MHNPRIFHIKSIDKKCKWLDNDHVMLHACFELLVDCVENDNLFSDFWTPVSDDGSIAGAVLNKDLEFKKNTSEHPIHKEFRELYDWWKFYLADFEYQNKPGIEEEENEMLIRLIKIRKHLWT